MSTSWISRKLRRTRQSLPPEIPDRAPLHATEVSARPRPQLRTTVAAKGLNGSKKTVITIKRYSTAGKTPQTVPETTSRTAPMPLGKQMRKQIISPAPIQSPKSSLKSTPKQASKSECTHLKSVLKQPLPLDRIILKPRSLQQPEHVQPEPPTLQPALDPALPIKSCPSNVECDTLSVFGIPSSYETACIFKSEVLESDNPASPSPTLCPPLKSPSFGSGSYDSVGSPSTLIVEDGLDSWGLPYMNLAEEWTPHWTWDAEPQLHLFGIGSDPDEMSYYDASETVLERTVKLDIIKYMVKLVLLHKINALRRKRAERTAELHMKLHEERLNQVKNQIIPLFAWM